ncbi:hypothetical protein ACEN8I_16170 [Polaromonas sp. CT11-55]|uniref:hypothetical protein n=1 Tax=Polaromonas sp. CT11-55 TaxID=3243045 RepID=UPI0039A75D29
MEPDPNKLPIVQQDDLFSQSAVDCEPTAHPPAFSQPHLIKDGMGLPEAAQIIASSANLSLETATAALRTVGYVDEIHALREVIELLAGMKTRFKALEKVVTHLPGIFQAFDIVGSLDPTVAEPSVYKKNSSIRWKSANWTAEGNYLEWMFFYCAPQQFAELLADDAPLRLDVLTVWWFYGSAVRLYGDQIPTWRDRDSSFATPDLDIAAVKNLGGDTGRTTAVEAGAVASGYKSWLAEVDPRNSPSGHGGIYSDVKLPRAMGRLSAVEELDAERLSTLAPLVEQTPLPRLGELELLKSHHNFPRPTELERLRVFLQNGKEPLSPLYHEANLIAMAIVSCRTVENNLQWRVYQNPSNDPPADRIEWRFESRSPMGGRHLIPAWHKAEHGVRDAQAIWYLPHSISHWLRSLDVGFGRPRLVDLLPLSEKDWPSRAYLALAKELDCTVERARRITRDLLARLIYHKTANAAVVHFFRSTTGEQIDRSDRIALSHYVPQGDGRAVKEHAAACRKLLSDTFPPGPHVMSTPLGAPHLAPSDMISISKGLFQHYTDATGVVEKHNRLAHFMLFACVAGTGHRRSSTPFPFPWDLHISEKLAFIADKLVTGSECRLVPLAPSLLLLLDFYVDHLNTLSCSNEVHSEVRDYARAIAASLRTSKAPPDQCLTNPETPTSGVFFEIAANGQRVLAKPISTRALDDRIEKLTSCKRTVQRLRAAAASYLWESGLSGRSVQTFLGHQPEMHSFGPGSSWSVTAWADEVSCHLERYLIESGIGIRGATHPPKPRSPSGTIPALQVSSHFGYEGRSRDKKWAQQSARAFIVQELNEYVLRHDETEITEEIFNAIRANAQEALRYDPAAADQVSGELKKQLAKLRKQFAAQVTAKAAYLGATTPGPMGIDFSRLFRNACVFRELWAKNVATPIGASLFDPIERLAHLTISLVVFDAILVPRHLESLLEDLESGTEYCDQGASLRCQVQSATHDYYFSANVGMTSTSLVLGALRLPPRESGPELWKAVSQRVGLILRKLLGNREHAEWSVQKLCTVFKPYWLSRLPGSMYSVAAGDHRGPAADARSHAHLLGGALGIEVVKPSISSKRAAPPIAKPQAHKDLQRLFRESRGILEKGERTKRKQRAALRAALTSESALSLSRWRSETQIVDLLRSFIGYLLDKGGKRVKTLAFTTLERYFSLIAQEMIALAWDIEFESISAEELTDLLNAVSARLNDKAAMPVLRYFTAHLRDEVDAPFCGAQWSNAWEPIRIRSTLVFPRHISKAVALLQAEGDEVAHQAAILTALMHGYGLRTKEGLNAHAALFDEVQPDAVHVYHGQIADLKTRSSRRFQPSSLNPESIQKLVRQAVTNARSSPHDGQFLFEDSTGLALISRPYKYISKAAEALRTVTGDPGIVPYHLRHSFATALVLGLFAVHVPALHAVTVRMLGSSYEKRIRDILLAPSDWPFLLERAAAVLGHASMTTLLNTYFHGSSFVIEASCNRWQPQGHLPDARLGAMLGWERTRVVKLRLRLPTDESRKPQWQDVVRHLVRQAMPKADESSIHSEESPQDNASTSWAVPWVAISRILLERFQSDCSLGSASEFAIRQLNVPPDTATQLITAYRNLVALTEMDDFEPQSSELLLPFSSHSKGTVRGRLERDRFVARAQAWSESDATHKALLVAFLKRWEARVDAVNPRVICTNQQELEDAMVVLKSLGASPKQLGLEIHGDPVDRWLNQMAQSWPLAKTSRIRASRGSKNILVKEVSISIAQSTEQDLPDGRDFHRSLIAVAVASAVLGSAGS